MQRFLSICFSPRGLVALGIVLGACFLSTKFGAHHSADGVFQQLYMHLTPGALVTGEHGHEKPLIDTGIPIPAAFHWAGAHAEGGEGEHGADGHGATLVVYNLQIFQIASVLLCLWCFLGVPKYLRTGKGDPLSKVFAGFAMWLRDDVIYPEMGKKLGRKFLPYFLTVFFFILFMNLMGLVPNSVTPTASIFVTCGLALTTLAAMLVCGMAVQGPVAFWKNLVPHVPAALWPLMFLVELIGLMVKPFALMVRLFANMTGGHMVVLSFMGLIFFMAGLWGDAGGWGASVLGVGFGVFIMIIESFVALLQAYIFTQLSVMFINASIHPEH